MSMLHPSHLQPAFRSLATGVLPAVLALGALGCQGVATHQSFSPAPGLPDLESGVANASAPVELAPVEHVLKPKLQGPAMHTLLPGNEKLVANPIDDSFSRYIKFAPQCSFYAYDIGYLDQRREDPLHQALLKEAITALISKSRLTDLMQWDERGEFAEALKERCERLLFPIHIGPTRDPYAIDEESGLRTGDSQPTAGTFRGRFYDHVLRVDGVKKTLQLDDGPVTSLEGNELDLVVTAADGSSLYVDVSAINREFVGELAVGAMGRVRQVFAADRIAQ